MSIFRGAQKMSVVYDNTETIQGNLELALQHYYFDRKSFTLSSRTDAGVHALNASAHVDLKPKKGHFPDRHRFLSATNRYLLKNGISIVITDFVRVPNTFHARFSAIKRIYLYRFAVPKENLTCYPKLPIEEWRRCILLKTTKFDIDKFRDCLKLFEGMHDFETFKKRTNQPWKSSIRTIYSIEVTPGLPMITSYNSNIKDMYDYWDVKIDGRSFVHNQIRRMIGTAIAVAEGKITMSEVKIMLTVPGRFSWNTTIKVALPYALYLCDVIYPEEALVFEEESESTKES